MTREAAREKDGKWKAGQSANPKGRPKGTRNKATLAAQALLDGQAEGLTQKAVDLALKGDMAALRLCIERLVPVRKDSPIKFKLPKIESAADIPKALSAITTAASKGKLTPSEATALAGLLAETRKSMELDDLTRQVEEIKARLG